MTQPPLTTGFLVSSAVHTRFGVYPEQERFEQTLTTLRNVRETVPNAVIFLVESSGRQPITDSEAVAFSRYANMILDFSTHDMVQDVHNKLNSPDVVKNFTELWVFTRALRHIAEKDTAMNACERLFKLSGRYQLTEHFNPDLYRRPDIKDKIVFAPRMTSQFSSEITGGATLQYMSRLWSWPREKTSRIAEKYQLMSDDFMAAYRQNQYRDIEHLLFKFFSADPDVVEVERVGVSGRLGPTGAAVAE